MSRLILVLVILLLIAGSVPAALFMMSTHSALEYTPTPKVIGAATAVKLKVVNPHGARHIVVYLEQDGSRTELFKAENPSNRWMFWKTKEQARELTFNVAGKKDGKARLVAEAQSNDLRASTDAISADVEIMTKPPAVSADGFQHYMNQGGSELVVFTTTGFWSEAGARAGKYTFRSFAKPGSQTERFSLFAYPWDLPPNTTVEVYAKNAAGNEATARFWQKLFPKSFRKRDLQLPDSFVEKVVKELDPNGSGDLPTRFLKINGEMRRQNNQTLAELRLKSEERFLWKEAFLQLPGSKVESQFADVRSYIYQGKKIDEQVHLGFDLSTTQHAPVLASNDGKIVYADRLGIYGNCIVVDHGYGLQSIYGHLSQIGVKVGDAVKRGQEMGRSGDTGMAGGDHLHFSMQIDGVQINPVEWWDSHWIQDRIHSKIQ